MKIYEGKLIARDFKFGIIVSRFNEFLSKRLLEGAMDALKRHDARDENIEVVWTPGSFEIPLIARRMALSKRYDGLICLGVILRGDTPHFEYICSEVAKGIAKINLDTGVPISFGIITADTIEQAIERAGTKSGNKGWQAAMSTIEMVNLLKIL
ncbi:MAG: 6,7-dimethyl-8-ribityllumazine synthase [Actinomycetota bacterium]|nr:6,7-dimethyl-8-ribityllumazine synthase [Actinomycetota bacterium]MDI6822163.1 6,7-dimethyl-8-ribityllumazine synthase [Actinomycetota bacterium]